MDEITLHRDFSDIDPHIWDRCFEGEAEAGSYYATAHAAAETGLQAMTVKRGGRVVALAPLFTLSYRLDTSLQGPLRHVTNQLARVNDRLLRLDLIGFGSALAERCHIGFDPALPQADRQALFATMLDAVDAYARQSGIGLVVVKDLALSEQETLAPVLKGQGFAQVASLPVAVLDVPSSEEAWLSALSSSTRKDIKRKLKGSGRVEIMRVDGLTDELAREIAALYEETRAQSVLTVSWLLSICCLLKSTGSSINFSACAIRSPVAMISMPSAGRPICAMRSRSGQSCCRLDRRPMLRNCGMAAVWNPLSFISVTGFFRLRFCCGCWHLCWLLIAMILI